MTDEKRYWYNVKTGEVEDGPQSMGKDRIGPIATRDEAANALASYEQRNLSWDEEDEDDDWGLI
ncbi:MAG: methionine aminopeptidase [Yaniella sp.]|nr:methionine aminopeptidase [Yaniella sp.]